MTVKEGQEAIDELKGRLDAQVRVEEPNLRITVEEEVAITEGLMRQLRIEYHTLRKQKMLNEAVGRTDVAQEIEKQMTNVVIMLFKLESGEV